jgi:beta-1,4-mannosyl-glycoprotein beta-1,4-N-acetylglucosaminyltransferase
MIIDTFIFNKDFKAFEIRINELREVVDIFVVSESRFTHSGKVKPMYLRSNLHRFDSEILSKLVVLSDDKKYFVRNPKIREMLQREVISKYLSNLDLKQNDLISHSDCDEIPRASVLVDLQRKSKSKDIDVILSLRNFANYLNLESGIWNRGRVQTVSAFKSIQNMRKDIFIFNAMDQRRHTLPLIRVPNHFTKRRFGFNFFPEILRNHNLQLLPDGGWHFNNLFLKQEIIEKIENSSHTEWNTATVRDNAIRNFVSGRDIYTGEKYKKVDIDETYPSYVYENLAYWEEYLIR